VKHIKIIAQDLKFTFLDEEFLETFNIEVVEHLKAFIYIYKTTFLYSFIEDQDVVVEIFRRPTLAAMVIVDVEVEEMDL
jgi:hypothetical protein